MRRSARLFSRLSLCRMICGLALFWTACAYAQNPSSTRDAKTLELQQVQESLEAAANRQKSLRAEIELLDRDIGAINRALVEAATSGQKLEANVSDAEQRLDLHLQQEASIKTRLLSRRDMLSEVLGALQRMGNNPPPALLIRPQDALASVRSAILVGAVVPGIRQETITIAGELEELRATRALVEQEKATLSASLNALAEDESRLSLLVEEKNRLINQSREVLEKERIKALELSNKATSLEELITSLESEIASAAAAAEAAKAADEARVKAELERLEKAKLQLARARKLSETPTSGDVKIPDVKDPTRIVPAVAFSKMKAALPKPTSGVTLYGFGDKIGPQLVAKGMAFATRPNARVISPVDGWVVYAGPFRSYGNILILNAGEAYHLVLSGLSEVNVTSGRFVLAGEPVGRMGTTRVVGAVPVDLGSNRPVLSVELRKDGKPVDPAPWWKPDDEQKNISGSPERVQKGSQDDS